MATTTNYSWVTPDDTSLVKDGAAAIRTLGSSIDTTTKALNPSTTLGDVEYRSSTSNTNTRLGIGTTGQVLTVSGGVPAWTTISSGGMTVIASGTLSSTAVDITSIPGTYKNLQLVIDSPEANNDAPMQVQYNSNTNDYLNSELRNRGGTTNTISPGTEAVRMGTALNANGSTDMQFVYDIFDYKNTTSWKTTTLSFSAVDSDGTNYVGTVVSQFRSSSAITSIRIRINGETFTSGSYILYGVN